MRGWADEIRRILDSGWGNVIGEGYAGFGGLGGGVPPKTEPLGLGFGWRDAANPRFGFGERDWRGVRWIWGPGRWGTSGTRGWGELGQKPKTEPLGLSFG